MTELTFNKITIKINLFFMSNNLFNKSRYLELLQKEKSLNGNDLCESEYMELLSYRVILESQITYNNREKYIALLEAHINEPFSNDDLDSYSALVELSELFDQEVEDLNLLENQILKEGIPILDNFSIDSISNSREFLAWVNDIVKYEKEEYIGPEDYRSLMEFRLSKLRDYANPILTTYKDNQVLQFVMVFFNSITAIAYSLLNHNIFNLLAQSANI